MFQLDGKLQLRFMTIEHGPFENSLYKKDALFYSKKNSVMIGGKAKSTVSRV
jgi:hypothetical protein